MSITNILKNKVVKSGIWYTVSSFVLRAISFITVPIFTRLMTKGEFGEYSNFITWMGLISIVATFTLVSAINRGRYEFKGQLDQFISTILLLGSIIVLLCYTIVIIGMDYFEIIFGMDQFYIHVIFIVLLTQPAIEIFQAKQRVLFKYKESVALSFAAALIPTGGALLMVIICQDKFFGRVIGFYIPTLIIGLVVFIYLVYKGKTFNIEYCKFAIAFCWPFIPHLLSINVLSASDRIMITNFCGTECTAIYTVAVMCASIPTIISSSINNAMSPWLFDKLEAHEENDVAKITLPYMAVYVIPTTLAVILAPEIVLVIGGQAYEEAVALIPPLFASTVVQLAYTMYVNIEQYSKKTWAIAGGSFIAASINVALNYFLIPLWGYQVAAYTTLIGYVVLFIVHFCFVRIIGYKNIYNDKVIVIVLAVTIVLLMVIQYIYAYRLLRFGIVLGGVIAFGIIAWRKKELFNNLK